MPITPQQGMEMLARCMRNKMRDAPVPSSAADREVEEIHQPILRWCNTQHPKVPYIHSRTDQPSTVGLGVPDFAVFYKGRCLLIEAKNKTGKLSPAQMEWQLLAKLQGFQVTVVRTYAEFEAMVKDS